MNRLRFSYIELALLLLFGFILFTVSGFAGCHHSAEALGDKTDGLPSTSSAIALAPDERMVWVVNPDADSVIRFDTRTLQTGAPISVGTEPWAVAITPSGMIVVMNRKGGNLSLIDEEMLIGEIPVGPELGGMALSPSGRMVYVTVSSADEVAVVNLQSRQVIERLPVGRLPWSVAVTNDGDVDDGDETIIVTHRQARLREGGREATNDGKEGWVTLLRRGEPATEISITPYSFGFPNTLEGIAVVGDTAWITHMLNSPAEPNTISSLMSGGISTISISATQECFTCRIDTNDSDFSTPVNFPRAIAVTADGQKAYVVLAGSDVVMGINLSDPETPKLIGFWAVGNNPRGIVLDQEGTRAYVMNYLSRDVSVLDLTNTVSRPELARIRSTPETLVPELLRGKILFNNASDPRMSRIGWMSCASCHPDGGADGTTWLIPEGARQTMPLWNLEGTAPFHVSGTRDEVQDFEGDIEELMGGIGLAPGPAQHLLGEPNEGRSVDLDALAAFALRGTRVPAANKIDTEAIARGRELFVSAGCHSCHAGPNWTRSSLPGEVGTFAPNGELVVEEILHDVGTYNPETDIFGEKGFDVPTLLAIHASAPYFHDGSVQTLEGVLAHQDHSEALFSAQEITDLTTFLRSVDADTQPFD